MNASLTGKMSDATPLPSAQFKRFVTVFHVVFIFGLIFGLVIRWRRPELRWDWHDATLVAIVALQIALYVRFLVIPWKASIALKWWLGYFAASYAIWLMEWQLERNLEWTVWAYFGQMFGVLRPRVSVPIAAGLFATYFGSKFGLKGLWAMSAWEWVGGLSLVVSSTAIGLFLHRLTVTSSERAKLIQQLEAAQKELEQARERDAELAALRERERLARDLHDSLGHGLVTLTVQLEAAQRLYPLDPARASALLDEMKDLTRTSMEQLRRSLAGLRAPGLGERSLGSALESLCEEKSRRDQLKVDLQAPAGIDGLRPAVAELLWRVAQEGLTNVGKHAKAQAAHVALLLETQQAILRVTDDGIGPPPNAEAKPGHYGLRGLRERVEGLGGVFTVSRANGKGTQIEARVPLIA